MLLTIGIAAAAAAKPARPNVLFILTDDQGYGDLERHGHPLLKTPHLNRLHDESVRFDNFYVSPSCAPTRAALLTGMHEFRNGVTHTLRPREHLFKGATLLPELLARAGYRCGFIGKWHLGYGRGYTPCERGFDWCSTNPMGPRKHFDPDIIRNGKRTPRKGLREDIFFDEAMTFIDETRNQPFFLYLSTYSPHTPLDAPEEFIEPFRGRVSEKHATYLGMVANLDANVGRLLAFLRERKLEENTIVIFMNDNGTTEGLDVYNAGMRGCKCTVWEGGSRAMSFWRWPGRWKPRTENQLAAHLDVLPTLCELAGAAVPDTLRGELEGFSLVPLLEAPVEWHKDRLLFHHVARWPSGLAASHRYAMCGVRKGPYLLLRSNPCEDPQCGTYQSQCTTLGYVRKGMKSTTYTQGNAEFHWGVSAPGRWSLFNVKEDPACRNDLASAKPELAATLGRAYDAWWDDVFPVMLARGGDEGDPEASRRAGRRDAEDQAGRKAAKENPPPRAAQTEESVFQRMDSDGNGEVTREEYVGLFARSFAHKDADGDGSLSREEFGFPAAFRHGDADGNKQLSLSEYKTFYAVQFRQRDKNRDGILTAGEM
jgi:arylsulfatase A-like enzyme